MIGKKLMIGLMINKENKDSSEDYESEEDNQILITQKISSEESSQDEEKSDDKKDCDGICSCSYKSINLISKNSKTPLKILISQLCAPHKFNIFSTLVY